jgi:hypothetical protein
MKKGQKCVIWAKVLLKGFCGKLTFVLLSPLLHKYFSVSGQAKNTTLTDEANIIHIV